MTGRQMIRVALAGNPNVGKSVVFNNLTGLHQHVGNWPGKTVEKAEGFCYFNSTEIYIVDLPGTYSLTAYSIEEKIARDYLIYEKPDVVVNIVDASNLERNLYLTLQLLELGVNVIVALNKFDLLEASGAEIDVRLLRERLGVPIIPTIASKKKGMGELCEAVLVAFNQPVRWTVKYSSSVEKYISEVMELLRGKLPSELTYRWVAIKLLEGDEEVASRVKALVGDEVMRRIEAIRSDFARELGDPETVFAEERYRVIENILEGAVVKARAVTVSDVLDQAFLDTAFGIPIFFAIMWVMFQFAFNVSAPFNDFLGDAFAWIAQMLSGATGVTWLDYLLFGDYGVLNGMGTVLSFVPLIFTLFFALSMLEDSGYMARAAFLTDKILGKFGLPGRAIISMILGFGCNVPAVYSTRTIPDEKDRIAAIVTNPLMLCGARFVFFAAIASALWGRTAGDVLLSLYVLGILLSLLVAIVIRKTVLRGESTAFIIELPQYLMPMPRVALSKAWSRAKLFFTKAGKVIFPGILVLGLLAVFTSNLTFTENVEDSIIASIGRSVQFIFTPLGWDWRFVVAAVFGFVAKEIVLGALALLYGASEDKIATVIASTHDPLTVYAYMVFILIYVPCIATIAAIKQEAGAKWALFTVTYEILLAYGMAWLVLNAGRLLGV